MKFGAESFVYDSMGNPTTYRNMTCVWGNGRQLKSITNGTDTAYYTYDEFGVRTKKINGGVTTNYVYENGKLLREITGSEKIDFIYGAEGAIGFRIGEANYIYRKNIFGDVTEIYDASGTLVGKYKYTAFGVCETTLDTNGIATKNPIRYNVGASFSLINQTKQKLCFYVYATRMRPLKLRKKCPCKQAFFCLFCADTITILKLSFTTLNPVITIPSSADL